MSNLPTFEGRQIEAALLKVTGTGAAGRALTMDDEVYVLVAAHVAGIDHTEKQGAFTRIHKLEVDRVCELPEAMDPAGLLEQANTLTGGQE